MAIKAKAAGLLVLLAGVLITGLAMASSGKKKEKLPAKPVDEGDTPPIGDDEVEVVIPGPDGTSETGPSIIVPVEEVLPEPGSGSGSASDAIVEIAPNTPGPDATPVDSQLQEEAAQEGIREEEAISEVVDSITQGQGVPPLAAEETSPELDPHGTVSLARLMLAREELPGWKADMQGEIKEWQAGAGLKADGLFGLKSVSRMATECGIIPLVRYYPKSISSKAQAKRAYDESIKQVIEALRSDLPDSQAQIDALTMCMGREKAQAFGNANPAPEKTLDFVQDINDAIAEAAETVAEKELSNVG